MRQSSAGQYDCAPLMCRPSAPAGPDARRAPHLARVLRTGEAERALVERLGVGLHVRAGQFSAPAAQAALKKVSGNVAMLSPGFPSLILLLYLTTHNPQPPSRGAMGDRPLEGRRRPQNDGQTVRKGCDAAAGACVCTDRRWQHDLPTNQVVGSSNLSGRAI